MDNSQEEDNDMEVDMETQQKEEEEAFLIRKEYRNIREEIAGKESKNCYYWPTIIWKKYIFFKDNRIDYVDPKSDRLENCLNNINEIFSKGK